VVEIGVNKEDIKRLKQNMIGIEDKENCAYYYSLSLL
jgi:hypothetical protein